MLAQGGSPQVRTTTFMVSVIVDTDCQISGAHSLSFGRAQLPSGAVLTLPRLRQLSHVEVSCSPNTRYLLSLDRGDAAESSVGQRLLVQRGNTTAAALRYQLYSDPDFSTIWGDGSSGSASSISNVGDGRQQLYTIYAEFPSQTMPEAGIYSSIITASVSF